MSAEQSTNATRIHTLSRRGGYLSIAGALFMFIGAAFWGTSGADDIWATLEKGDFSAYLSSLSAAKSALAINTSFWIMGVLTMGMAGTVLTQLCEKRQDLAQLALVFYRTAVPLAIIAFLAMFSLAAQLAPDTSPTAVSIAKVVGWIGARADDLATALIVGFASLLVSIAGRGDWMPNWLVRWGYFAGGVGLFSLAVLAFPGMSQYGFAIVPVGLGWLLATGIVLLRRKAV